MDKPVSEMVRRVAEAIATFSSGSADNWTNYTEEAIAAIKAMREVDNYILAAGYRAMFVDEWDGHQAPMMGAGWDAMLSAALGDTNG